MHIKIVEFSVLKEREVQKEEKKLVVIQILVKSEVHLFSHEQ